MGDIFKAYDIRGIYPSEINKDDAYYIGKAIARSLKQKVLLVGRDARKSSPALYVETVKGILSEGVKIIDIGLCSTPLFDYSCARGYAGVMITASHNPAKYNGFKICRRGGIPVSEDSGMKRIERLYKQLRKEKKKDVVVDTQKESFLLEYINTALQVLHIDKRYRVVVDAGNGMGALIYKKLMQKTKMIDIIPLYFKIDMTFPNHEANPKKTENLKALMKRVVKEKADFGIALDGDSDRIVFVDEKGGPVPSDVIIAIIARQVLKRNKGAKILYEVGCSKIVPEIIKKYKGRPVEYKVGHSFIKRKMKAEKILFGGETSGHFYHIESNYMESTLLVLFKILNELEEEKKSLSQLVKGFKKYVKIEETNFHVKNREKALKRVYEFYKRYKHKTKRIDGVKMTFKSWWFSLRKSNTEPLVRLNLEANNKNIIKKRLAEIKALLKDV